MIIKKIILIVALSCMISNSKADDSINFIVGLGCLGGAAYMATELWKAAETALEGNAVMLVNSGFNILGWSPKVPVTVSAFEQHVKDLIKKNEIKKNEAPQLDDVLRYVRIRYGTAIGWGMGTCGLLIAGLMFLGKKAKNNPAPFIV